MGSASFINLPRSTQLSAHSVYGRTAVPARAAWGRSAALLVLAASSIIGRSCCSGWTRPVIPESLPISTLQLLVSRTPAMFADPNVAPQLVRVERRQWRLARILLLHLDDIHSENLGRLLARYRHCPRRERHARSTLHTDRFSLLQSVIASGLIDARRAILVGDSDYCLHFPLEQIPPEYRPSAPSTFRRFAQTVRRRRIPIQSRPYLMPANGYGEQAAPSWSHCSMDHRSYPLIADSHPFPSSDLEYTDLAEVSDWVVECHGLCVVHFFAARYQVPGTFCQRRQRGPGERC